VSVFERPLCDLSGIDPIPLLRVYSGVCCVICQLLKPRLSRRRLRQSTRRMYVWRLITCTGTLNCIWAHFQGPAIHHADSVRRRIILFNNRLFKQAPTLPSAIASVSFIISPDSSCVGSKSSARIRPHARSSAPLLSQGGHRFFGTAAKVSSPVALGCQQLQTQLWG
jgi:hypothetical protein